MIYHASIPAKDPGHVARVLAELLDGRATPFAGHPGAYMAWSGRHAGHLIEVLPAAAAAFASDDDARALYDSIHFALAVNQEPEVVLAVGAREGWRTRRCRRGGSFDVIEFWLENHFMIEVLTPQMQREYLDSCSA